MHASLYHSESRCTDSQAFWSTQQSNIIHSDNFCYIVQNRGTKTGRAISPPASKYRTATTASYYVTVCRV